MPPALQTWLQTVMPEALEAGAAMFVTVSQLAIAAGSALGGVLVDSAGLDAVFGAGGIVAIGAAISVRPRAPNPGSNSRHEKHAKPAPSSGVRNSFAV